VITYARGSRISKADTEHPLARLSALFFLTYFLEKSFSSASATLNQCSSAQILQIYGITVLLIYIR
jgi:hypothetical protein